MRAQVRGRKREGEVIHHKTVNSDARYIYRFLVVSGSRVPNLGSSVSALYNR